MKRLLIILLLLLLLVSPLNAQMLQGCMSAGGAAAASCSTPGQSCTTTVSLADWTANWYYIASQFQASETATVCSLDMELKKSGTPTGTHKVAIYTNNAGGCSTYDCPGTIVGNWSDNLNIADLTTSYAWYNFSKSVGGLNAALTSGTKYWIVHYSSTGNHTSIVTESDTGCTSYTGQQQSDNGTSWTYVTTPRAYHYKFYK